MKKTLKLLAVLLVICLAVTALAAVSYTHLKGGFRGVHKAVDGIDRQPANGADRIFSGQFLLTSLTLHKRTSHPFRIYS